MGLQVPGAARGGLIVRELVSWAKRRAKSFDPSGRIFHVSRSLQIFLGVLALTLLLALLAAQDIFFVSSFALTVLLVGLAGGLTWLAWRLLKRFLWKVGRRLSFSYFLIGVLPIPLVALLLTVVSILLAGFFLGHLARDAVRDVHLEVSTVAREHLVAFDRTGRTGPATRDDTALGYYRGLRRVAGDSRLPEAWPTWLDDAAPRQSFVLTETGTSPTLAAGAQSSTSDRRVLAVHVGDLNADLRRTTGFWIEGHYPGEPGGGAAIQRTDVRVFGREVPVSFGLQWQPEEEAKEAYFSRKSGGSWFDRPVLRWGEVAGPLRRLQDGDVIANETILGINATPRIVQQRLFSSSAEVDSAAWGSILVLASLLFNIYLAAVVMALFLIFGLSRAVNRLSAATETIREGDFSVRIPVRRKDQVGELQDSFNRMAANLEDLVSTAAQKEVLEKELSIARDLQQSLLPRSLPEEESLELAALFEPSAAIGGDYYDVFRLSDRKLAVVVADVSGHGLPTGLRMAMLKAALMVLVQDPQEMEDPEDVLKRLDGVVRSEQDRRFFVTATLAILDLEAASVTLVNAGHPPTYLRRGPEPTVEEILLPGPPLGALRPEFGRRTLPLEPGDVLVWMSDGILESRDAQGEPLGYEGVRNALAGGDPWASAATVRDRLVDAVSRHTEGRPVEDDRTIVVLRFGIGAGAGAESRE